MTREQYKSLANRRLATIKVLKRRLAVEMQLNKAMSKLDFTPKQNPARLKEVRKSTTIRRKLMERRVA